MLIEYKVGIISFYITAMITLLFRDVLYLSIFEALSISVIFGGITWLIAHAYRVEE